MNEPKVILVRYLGSNSKPYAYLVPPGMVIEQEDLLVVEARDTYALAKATKIDDINPEQASYANKFVVQVVDLDSHSLRMQEARGD